MSSLPAYMYAHYICTCSLRRPEEGNRSPLELELHMIVSNHVGAEN